MSQNLFLVFFALRRPLLEMRTEPENVLLILFVFWFWFSSFVLIYFRFLTYIEKNNWKNVILCKIQKNVISLEC